MTNKRLEALVFCLWIGSVALNAQPVTHHPEPAAALASRWAWALEQAPRETGFWVGYSIDKMMHARSFIGSYNAWRAKELPSLYEMLGRQYGAASGGLPETERVWRQGEGAFYVSGDDAPEALELKEVAILVYFTRAAAAPSRIELSNLSLAVSLNDRPLYWLGGAGQNESLDRVVALYGAVEDREAKEDLLTAAGVHDASPRVLAFLENTLRTESDGELREDAVFWIGQQDTKEALTILQRLLDEETSNEIRKKAVFSVSQMSGDEALETLIGLAKHERDGKIRKEAIFWLGQKASEQATESLEKMAYDDADVEVQEHAVFALSQLPAEEAVPRLMDIATTHPHLKVRKRAIFWLGESGDPRAVDLLISLVGAAGAHR